jgi:uncharacterized protein YraI
MKLGIAFAFVLAAGLTGPAAAQSHIGYTNTDANLRTGPDSGYPPIETVPYGERLVIHGCINDWSWCDVEWRRDRGWMAAAYLETDLNGQRVVVIDNRPSLAWPILTFALTAYWYDHYRYRNWYRERDYWYNYRPPVRPPIRPPVHRPYPPVNRPPVNRPRPVPRPTPSTRPVTRPEQTNPTPRPVTKPIQPRPTQRPATRPAQTTRPAGRPAQSRPVSRPAPSKPAPQRRPAPAQPQRR